MTERDTGPHSALQGGPESREKNSFISPSANPETLRVKREGTSGCRSLEGTGRVQWWCRFLCNCSWGSPSTGRSFYPLNRIHFPFRRDPGNVVDRDEEDPPSHVRKQTNWYLLECARDFLSLMIDYSLCSLGCLGSGSRLRTVEPQVKCSKDKGTEGLWGSKVSIYKSSVEYGH